METRRIEWIDVTRVIAMLLVIFGHCHYYSIMTDFGGLNYMIDEENYSLVTRILKRLNSFVYSFHMPLFMMISGMCYTFTMKKSKSLCCFIHEKFVRLVLPFWGITLFLNVPLKWLSGYWNDSKSILYDVICGQFLLMGNSHLWFVVSLFWIFICVEIIIRCQKYVGYNHAIVIFILVLLNLVSVSFHYDYLGIPNAIHYLLYFYLGYYLLPFVDKWDKLSIVYISLSFVFWLFFQTINNRLALVSGSLLIFQTINSILSIVVAVGASISCCLLCKLLSRKGVKGGIFRNNTYELYLYSDPFNYLIILLLWMFWGEMVLKDNLIALMAFLLRFLGSIAFAFLVILVVKSLRIKDAGKKLIP